MGRMLAVLALLLVLSSMLTAFFWTRMADAHAQERLVAQQNLEADLWARMLTARMEAHQRLLDSIAQGMHSSLLDKPAVLDALMQQEGSMLRLFESLHVALPSGEISHHGALGAVVDIDTSGTTSLRRTMTEGKPSVTYLNLVDDIQHLSVLLSVPIRQPDGSVAGALGAKVKLPIAALMPKMGEEKDKVQYALLDSEGTVLAHSLMLQQKMTAEELFGTHMTQWSALSQPSTANADTQVWGDTLASRVGLPLPQWQAVILRDLSAESVWQRGVPLMLWLSWLLSAGVLLALGTAALRMRHPDSRMPEEAPRAVDAEEEHLPDWKWLDAAWGAVPVAMMVEQCGQIRTMTPQARVLLGYFQHDAEQVLSLELVLDTVQEQAAVRNALTNFGSYEGVLQLRKKDGDALSVQAVVRACSHHTDFTVWRLQLPWQSRADMPLPDKEHAWHDSLTGLPNRDAFMWGLQSWVSDSMQAPTEAVSAHVSMPTQGCVLFADIDHLGMMNETATREMGNRLLRHVGRLMADHTQPLGQMARLGGDEFAVLLPGVSLAHAQAVAQSLCDAVWGWQPHWSGERHWVSISIGVVAMDAQRHTPQQALRAADMACYEAKRRGRCQVAVGQISAQPALQA